MKERPILFNADMVRALLDGRKTQTRRIVKPQPPETHSFGGYVIEASSRKNEGKFKWGIKKGEYHFADSIYVRCPYGQPGDRLWVRESFWGCDLPGYGDQPCVVYDNEWQGKEYKPEQPRPWARKFGRIPSIHMPKDCSRILLEIVSVRVERLQDISEADAMAEGIDLPEGETYRDYAVKPEDNEGHDYYFCPQDSFISLWEKINGLESCKANPWVWVVEFKRVEL